MFEAIWQFEGKKICEMMNSSCWKNIFDNGFFDIFGETFQAIKCQPTYTVYKWTPASIKRVTSVLVSLLHVNFGKICTAEFQSVLQHFRFPVDTKEKLTAIESALCRILSSGNTFMEDLVPVLTQYHGVKSVRKHILTYQPHHSPTTTHHHTPTTHHHTPPTTPHHNRQSSPPSNPHPSTTTQTLTKHGHIHTYIHTFQFPIRKKHPIESVNRETIQNKVTAGDTAVREALSLGIQAACGWGAVFCFRTKGHFKPCSDFYEVLFGNKLTRSFRKIIE